MAQANLGRPCPLKHSQTAASVAKRNKLDLFQARKVHSCLVQPPHVLTQSTQTQPFPAARAPGRLHWCSLRHGASVGMTGEEENKCCEQFGLVVVGQGPPRVSAVRCIVQHTLRTASPHSQHLGRRVFLYIPLLAPGASTHVLAPQSPREDTPRGVGCTDRERSGRNLPVCVACGQPTTC